MAESVQQKLRNQAKLVGKEPLWKPQPGPQLAACDATWVFELLFGGARGGSKSIFLLLDFLQDVPVYHKHWQGILIRKSYPELEQIIADSWKIFPQTGAIYEKQPKTWVWPNGANLRFRNLETLEDAHHYQGHGYTWGAIDEAGTYGTPDVYFAMLATIRCGDAEIPTMRFRLTANPGGPGHHWLKNRFIDPAPQGYTPIHDTGDQRCRMFIPSRITDNKILMQRDPYYVENLKKQASPELVKAWLYGDWNVQISSFFPEFSVLKHVIKPFIIPDHWPKFRSFDWGSAKPFAVHWWAVSDGSDIIFNDGTKGFLQRGSLVCYREWYGMQAGRPNVGLGLKNEAIAEGIKARTPKTEKIAFTTTDSLPFQDRGGIMMAEIFHRAGVPLKRGDTDRVTGWQQLRSRLQGTQGGPLIYFIDTCPNMIRCLPALQADKHNNEDVDSDCEDHAPDGCRLACMERSTPKDEQKISTLLKPMSEMTYNDLLRYDEIYGDRE